MNMVVLYTTSCPQCRVLETKLRNKNIEFSIVDDVSVMEEKGFMSAPMLEVDGEVMNFTEGNNWINQQGE